MPKAGRRQLAEEDEDSGPQPTKQPSGWDEPEAGGAPPAAHEAPNPAAAAATAGGGGEDDDPDGVPRPFPWGVGRPWATGSAPGWAGRVREQRRSNAATQSAPWPDAVPASLHCP